MCVGAGTQYVRFNQDTEMTSYIFEDHESDQELRRLRRIEAALDPCTRDLLERTGVTAGWSALEVGAGAGSILRWLGERVGHDGEAIAVDKRATYLSQFTARPFQVIESDVLEMNRPGSFDLIHARYVLIHNRNSAEILAHLKSLLKPGGQIVIEEPDFQSAEWIDEHHRAAGQRVNRAICAMFSGMALDPGHGKRLPLLMSRTGFGVNRVDARSHLECGGGPIALMMAGSAEALREKYVGSGQATNDDVDEYMGAAHDPASWAIYYSTVGVIASNPR
jgi:2-polyprenyl-3-methyl-5-hydroxy-6-metoxy-1,4-benzoquinol methylase